MVLLSESTTFNEKEMPLVAMVKRLAETSAVSKGVSHGLYVGWSCFKFEVAQKGLSFGLGLLSDKVLLEAFLEAGAEGLKYGLIICGCVALVDMMLDHYMVSSGSR